MTETRHLVAISVRGPEDASFTFTHPAECYTVPDWEACVFKAATPSPRYLPLSSFPAGLGVYAVEILDGAPSFEFVRKLGPDDWHG
jgi:hypothetical protein